MAGGLGEGLGGGESGGGDGEGLGGLAEGGLMVGGGEEGGGGLEEVGLGGGGLKGGGFPGGGLHFSRTYKIQPAFCENCDCVLRAPSPEKTTSCTRKDSQRSTSTLAQGPS